MEIRFDQHSFVARLTEVRQTRLADLINVPDKRIDDQGESYTPSLLMCQFEEGALFFVLEDIQALVLTTTELRVIMNSGYTVHFRQTQ